MELTEGELIEQIEQLDEGWWSGVGEGGAKSGLFPGIRFPHYDLSAISEKYCSKLRRGGRAARGG